MRPLIGVTTSEVRLAESGGADAAGRAAAPRDGARPDLPARDRGGRRAARGDAAAGARGGRAAAGPPRRHLPVGRPRPRPGRLRRAPPPASSARPSPSSTSFELELARRADARGLPILAICRGLQALNVARGGTLHQHLPDRPGTTSSTARRGPGARRNPLGRDRPRQPAAPRDAPPPRAGELVPPPGDQPARAPACAPWHGRPTG